jgi:ribonuclease BN (tRNA processing enzyme)
MRVTVLGSAASCPGPGQACAGYLVEAAGARVLLDCGHGVLGHLGQVFDPLALDAVFVTHAHADHFADLYALHAMIRYAPEGPAGPVPLYLPAGLWDQMRCLLSERGSADIAEAFVPIDLVAQEPVRVGRLTVTPFPVEHTDPTFALRVEGDGVTFAYTADTSPTDRVLLAMVDADLVLAEATLPQRYEGAAPHLTPAQAGKLAREAGAHALALTHVWWTNDREEMAADASREFGAQVIVASEFDVFAIESDSGRD